MALDNYRNRNSKITEYPNRRGGFSWVGTSQEIFTGERQLALAFRGNDETRGVRARWMETQLESCVVEVVPDHSDFAEKETENRPKIIKSRTSHYPSESYFSWPNQECTIAMNSDQKSPMIISLFIDGLLHRLLDDKFISHVGDGAFARLKADSLFFSRVYASGEWSLPSVASVFSGLRVIEHGVWHPRKAVTFPTNVRSVAHNLAEKGWMTYQVGANWRRNPAYGFTQGFHRTIYQKAMRFCNVLDSFFFLEGVSPTGPSYFDLTAFDLHGSVNQLDLDKNIKGPKRQYNLRAQQNYVQALRNLNRYLQILLDYVDERCGFAPTVLVVWSDHGQSYFQGGDDPLKDSVIRVPMYIYGSLIENQECQEIISNRVHNLFVDVLAEIMITHNEREGQRKERKANSLIIDAVQRQNSFWTYCESVFPQSRYQARAISSVGEVRLESEQLISEDGFIPSPKVAGEFVFSDSFRPHDWEYRVDSMLKETQTLIDEWNTRRDRLI